MHEKVFDSPSRALLQRQLAGPGYDLKLPIKVYLDGAGGCSLICRLL